MKKLSTIFALVLITLCFLTSCSQLNTQEDISPNLLQTDDITVIDNTDLIKVPDLSGSDEESAKTILSGKNLIPIIEYESSGTVRNGIVIRTNPSTGVLVEPDSRIIVVVSLGSEVPTAAYTSEQTTMPTSKAVATPTLKPTATPTSKPTATPTSKPTATPMSKPTATPMSKPTATPTSKPTATLTSKPTATPTSKPTATPTSKPTATPTSKPTSKPKPTVTPELYSDGLSFNENSDGTYTLIGIGTCTDSIISIPAVHNGKPVKAIGDKAFSDLTSITKVIIPNGIQSIGARAFYNSGIKEINIPESVTTIGIQIFYKADNLHTVYYNSPYRPSNQTDNPFMNNSSLTKIVFGGKADFGYTAAVFGCRDNAEIIEIGKGVSKIGRGCFLGFEKLRSIVISDSVLLIESGVFRFCSSLESIIINENNPHYRSSGNCIVDISTKSLIAGCKNSVIPTDGSVTIIGPEAFSNIPLKSIDLPSSVTRILDGAFNSCNLTSIDIPDSVTYIDGYAFSYCENLTNINIPKSVTFIGRGTFIECKNLSNATIPFLAESMFEKCTSLSDVNITGQCSIISQNAFKDCENLMSFTIPDSVTTIGSAAFEGCTRLSNIVIPDSVNSIGGRAFVSCENLKSIIIPDSVTAIGLGAFSHSGLTSVRIPDGVLCITQQIFAGCNNLTDVTIGRGVVEISPDAFQGSQSIVNISVADGNRKYHSSGNCIIETSTKELIIGFTRSVIPTDGSVTSLGELSFMYSQFESISIPDSIVSIGDGAFLSSRLKTVYYAGSEAQWKAIIIEDRNRPLENATIFYNYNL